MPKKFWQTAYKRNLEHQRRLAKYNHMLAANARAVQAGRQPPFDNDYLQEQLELIAQAETIALKQRQLVIAHYEFSSSL